MRFLDRYPIIVTPHKNACRDFWVRCMDLTVGFDSDWFVWLAAADGSVSLAFMTPDHPSAPPGREPYAGAGMCFELQVDDAEAALAAFISRGGRAVYPLTDEPFGQRRFGFADPSGLWVDVVQQIEPAADYWARYMTSVEPPSGTGTAG